MNKCGKCGLCDHSHDLMMQIEYSGTANILSCSLPILYYFLNLYTNKYKVNHNNLINCSILLYLQWLMFIFKTLSLSFDLKFIFYVNFIHCTIFKICSMCLWVVSRVPCHVYTFQDCSVFRLESRIVINNANVIIGWVDLGSGIRIKMNMHGDHNKSMFCLTELILIFSLYMNWSYKDSSNYNLRNLCSIAGLEGDASGRSKQTRSEKKDRKSVV